MQKTIVFDFDGSLADSWPLMLDIFNKYAEEYGFTPLSDDQVTEFKRMSTRELLKAYKIPLTKALKLKKMGGKLMLERVNEIKVFAGMTEVLLALKEAGYRVGILTFNLPQIVDAVLEKAGWNMFDFKYCVPGFKSKTRSFKRMLKEQEIDVESMIYVGDEIRDIELARQFGAKVVSVGWGYNSVEVLEQHSPDALVSEISQLLNTLVEET